MWWIGNRWKVYCGTMALVFSLRSFSRRSNGCVSAFTTFAPTTSATIATRRRRKIDDASRLLLLQRNSNQLCYYHSSTLLLEQSSDNEEIIRKNGRPLLDWYSEEGKEYELPECGEDEMRELKEGQRIVAFGDVHGDLEKLRQFLVTAKIMDEESTVEDPIWVGGDTICVQTGDILDRGDDELACFRLLTSLSRQAVEVGGKLILLYGNHESLNAVGLFHYANPGGNLEMEQTVGDVLDTSLQTNRWRLQFAGNQPSRWAAFEPGGLLAYSLLKQMKVAVVVGKSVFVHAGLTTSHLNGGTSIKPMNQAAQQWITTSHHGPNNNSGIQYQSVDDVIAAANRRAKQATQTQPSCLGGGIGDMSPIWMRTYSQPHDAPPSNPKAQSMIDALCFTLKVDRMVMGHTPQNQINVALNDKAWRIDVGASKGVMDGHVEVLEILHSTNGPDTIHILRYNQSNKIPYTQRQIMQPSNTIPTSDNLYNSIF